MKNEPNLSGQPPKKRHTVGRLVALLSVLALCIGAFFYGSQVLDMISAAKYTPSAQISQVESRLDFTSRGQQIFYATAPAVQNKEQFNVSCASTERTVAILGCYYKDKIYLYNIQNEELDGTLEVTAAHEMLHAAYHRLNYFERKKVDELVESEYQRIKDEPEISQVMAYYKEAEPGAELDELHSIIGTTIADLPPELEQYYARYFTDRTAIVALNAKYNAVFSELNAEADALQKQIDAEGPAIKAAMSVYDIDLAQLNLDVQSFNARASSGAFNSQAEFNVARAALQARVSEINARRRTLNARVDAYNADIEALNKLAIHVNSLNQSINGVEAPSGVKQ